VSVGFAETLLMALHRDIYWVGRQWAVTGHGIQAVDQRRQGAFDVSSTRVWDDGLLAPLREFGWFNEADFEKALQAARRRFPPPQQPVVGPAPEVHPPAGAGEAIPPDAPLQLCVRGALARFLPQWRIRH
jgi:hypothetical protein